MQRFETGRHSIRQLIPVDLLSTKDIKLPAAITRRRLRPYAKRLKALQEAEQIFDTLATAVYEMEQNVPNEHVAMVDRLWFGKGDSRPFITARRAWRQLEDDLERWEESLEAERAELCRDIFGIAEGDIVLMESEDKMVRIQLESTTIFNNESNVHFQLSGTRFRKDGTLGKRKEGFYIRVNNDL